MKNFLSSCWVETTSFGNTQKRPWHFNDEIFSDAKIGFLFLGLCNFVVVLPPFKIGLIFGLRRFFECQCDVDTTWMWYTHVYTNVIRLSEESCTHVTTALSTRHKQIGQIKSEYVQLCIKSKALVLHACLKQNYGNFW